MSDDDSTGIYHTLHNGNYCSHIDKMNENSIDPHVCTWGNSYWLALNKTPCNMSPAINGMKLPLQYWRNMLLAIASGLSRLGQGCNHGLLHLIKCVLCLSHFLSYTLERSDLQWLLLTVLAEFQMTCDTPGRTRLPPKPYLSHMDQCVTFATLHVLRVYKMDRSSV